MYLLDDRFSTAVAFVEGFSAAHDENPLNGFQEWVCRRMVGGYSSRHWAYVLASAQVPGMLMATCPSIESLTSWRMA